MERRFIMLIAALFCTKAMPQSVISLKDYEDFFKDLRSCSPEIVEKPPLRPPSLTRDHFTIISNVQLGLPLDDGKGGKSVEVKYKYHFQGKCPKNGDLKGKFIDAQVDSVYVMRISSGSKDLELLGDDTATPSFNRPVLSKDNEIMYSELTCVLDLDFLPEFNICPTLKKSDRDKLLAKIKTYTESKKK